MRVLSTPLPRRDLAEPQFPGAQHACINVTLLVSLFPSSLDCRRACHPEVVFTSPARPGAAADDRPSCRLMVGSCPLSLRLWIQSSTSRNNIDGSGSPDLTGRDTDTFHIRKARPTGPPLIAEARARRSPPKSMWVLLFDSTLRCWGEAMTTTSFHCTCTGRPQGMVADSRASTAYPKVSTNQRPP